MNIRFLKYSFFTAAGLVVLACSTKKNTFLSRNSHALSSKYNILYNGGVAMEKGKADLKTTYKDNFWERLPIERLQISQEATKPGENRNANFVRAEEKATKAIQKHSMYIDGAEKNPQMDEAHLMLGKARYFEQRFVPALEAFNYILYKYPESDKIYEAKIWREKTNVRLENEAVAIANLRKLLTEIKFRDQIYADANAALATAFLAIEEKDSAVARLKLARDFTKDNEEEARYRFVIGQLYEELGQPDSAFAAFQDVIDMKRKSPRQYVIQAHAHQASQFPIGTGDTLAFVEKYKELLEDRENRPYLDALNHQVALFYDRQKNYRRASEYYNKSLKNKSQDQYMVASNYRNLATIYFENAKYALAGKYYDSTMANLNQRSREFKQIKKKRENLEDVIKYEAIASRNDSIINVLAMSDAQRNSFYQDYIDKLKKEDEARKALEEKAARDAEEAGMAGDDVVSKDSPLGKMSKEEAKRMGLQGTKGLDMNAAGGNVTKKTAVRTGSTAPGTFYFYNPNTVAFGINEFRKVWGNRAYKNNWRTAGSRQRSDEPNEEDPALAEEEKEGKAKSSKEKLDPRYTVEYYTSQLPGAAALDSLMTERNFAYYQLGLIYKEKFREYKRATVKLEELLASQPEERLVLPAMYHLYKIYEITGNAKGAELKSRIISQYPDSRYAQILSATDSESVAALAPEAAYGELFKKYTSGDYLTVLREVEFAIEQYTGDEIVSKFELLKANVIGKVRGLEAFKTALNYVALNYPNSSEGKQAESMLEKDIPKLESLKFAPDEAPGGNWKILYRAKKPEDPATKALIAKVNKFMDGRKFDKIKTSFDLYTETDNFLIIHGFATKEAASGMANVLKDHKDFKVSDTPIIISSWNYQIVQMRKNLDQFLAGPETELPAKTEVAKTIEPIPVKGKGNEIPAERAMQMQREQQETDDPEMEEVRRASEDKQRMRGRAGGEPQPVNPPSQTTSGNPSPNRTVPQSSAPTTSGYNTPPPSQNQQEVGGPPPAPQLQNGK